MMACDQRFCVVKVALRNMVVLLTPSGVCELEAVTCFQETCESTKVRPVCR